MRAIEMRVPVNVWAGCYRYRCQRTCGGATYIARYFPWRRSSFYPENLQQPDVEDYVSRLRSVYRLRYTSIVSQSGAHMVRVEAIYGTQTAVTPDTQIGIDLNLPTAVLVGLPDEVKREYENSGGRKTLQPGFITLQANFLFPDGYERQLKAHACM